VTLTDETGQGAVQDEVRGLPDPDADVLTCTSCGRSYPVVDGIPVLLLEEASPPVTAPGG